MEGIHLLHEFNVENGLFCIAFDFMCSDKYKDVSFFGVFNNDILFAREYIDTRKNYLVQIPHVNQFIRENNNNRKISIYVKGLPYKELDNIHVYEESTMYVIMYNYFDYIDLALDICLNLKKIGYGKYRDKKDKYTINVTDYIRYMNKIIPANASANIRTNEISLSKINFLNNFTVFERVAVLCHEYGHLYFNKILDIDSSNETGSDLTGMKMYIDYGFHPYDFISALVKIYEIYPSENNRKRIDKIFEFGKKYYDNVEKRKIYAYKKI